MINTSQFFSGFKEPISSGMLESCSELVLNRHKYNWQSYYNFYAVQVTDEEVFKDSFFRKLRESRNFIVGIIEIKPYHFYDWHVDTDRNCGINIPLDVDDSKCLFREEAGINVPVFELSYKFRTAYLFNTQKEHCVYNGVGYRRMISVRFLDDKPYDVIREELKDTLV
tara:strand:- start:48 stop:551 length:504 start_codon:yes stop_codon:yes gene_type:complete